MYDHLAWMDTQVAISTLTVVLSSDDKADVKFALVFDDAGVILTRADRAGNVQGQAVNTVWLILIIHHPVVDPLGHDS